MNEAFYIVVRNDWGIASPLGKRRLAKNLFPLGNRVNHLAAGCRLLLRARTEAGIELDSDATLVQRQGEYFLHSRFLSMVAQGLLDAEFTAFYFDGNPSNALCTVQPLSAIWLDLLREDKASLRLEAFDIPPATATDIANRQIVDAISDLLISEDPELNARDAVKFLESPHILTQLFAHALALRSEDSPDFVVDLRKVAEQMRRLLLEYPSSVGICRIERSHAELWSAIQGERIAFLDGGVARIPGVARQEPLALRVGVYSVIPGEPNLAAREHWEMLSFLVSDCVDAEYGISERTDRRRLMEAARYTFEPLAALEHLEKSPGTTALLLHGPLVNQFAMYDEGEPNYIPALDEQFLARHRINSSAVSKLVERIPKAPGKDGPYWNHFMAIYPYVLKHLFGLRVPIAGVVERAMGRPITHAVLTQMQRDNTFEKRYLDKVNALLDRYDVSDELLFGCVLREGEYIRPVRVNKTRLHKSRDRWKPVVNQLPQPFSTMVKTDKSSFPFRVELNEAANKNADRLLRLIYHTSRLLPRYAFPVGLDIADKFAKVPDWIARGISAELSSFVLRRALSTGDPNVVAQVRRLLAASPRDFFYRPTVDI